MILLKINNGLIKYKTACELDAEYYEAAKKRFFNHSAQTKLFTP